MIAEKTIERVKSVNNTLRRIGYEWNQIEEFWKECIQKARENEKSKQQTGNTI